MRQADVQAHVQRARLVGAPVGGLHDAGAAARADVDAVGRSLAFAVVGHQAGKLAGKVVVARVAHGTARALQLFFVAAGLGFAEQGGRLVGRQKACAAIHHHGVLDALLGLAQVGLEHFQLEPDAARFTAEQELGVGKRKAVGIGVQGVVVVGVRVQLGPGIGQAAFVELGVGFHGDSRRRGGGRTERVGL